MNAEKKPARISITQNRKALHNYSISDKIEAGIVLHGHEVKSIRAHSIHLTDSYAKFKDNELWLIHCYIDPYTHHTQSDINPTRDRKLLLHKNELAKLKKKIERANVVLIPLHIYIIRNHVKVSLGIGQSKKKFDKRDTIKTRDTQRDMDRRYKII